LEGTVIAFSPLLQTPAASISLLEVTLRIGSALLLGSAIGLERQWRQRNAGLRTNALVCTGTALFIILPALMGQGGAQGNIYQIPAYVVSGIGFLAGGVIFKERLSVSGLNTAATLWCTAAVGVLTGFGFFLEACIGVVAIMIANVVLRPVARLVNMRSGDDSEVVSSYELHAVCKPELEEQTRAAIVTALNAVTLPLLGLYTEPRTDDEGVKIVADISATGRAEVRLERVISKIAVIPGVSAVSWRLVPTNEDEQALVQSA
jgi:putative Mg2+ transporter-C (MgtC) family protein